MEDNRILIHNYKSKTSSPSNENIRIDFTKFISTGAGPLLGKKVEERNCLDSEIVEWKLEDKMDTMWEEINKDIKKIKSSDDCVRRHKCESKLEAVEARMASMYQEMSMKMEAANIRINSLINQKIDNRVSVIQPQVTNIKTQPHFTNIKQQFQVTNTATHSHVTGTKFQVNKIQSPIIQIQTPSTQLPPKYTQIKELITKNMGTYVPGRQPQITTMQPSLTLLQPSNTQIQPLFTQLQPPVTQLQRTVTELESPVPHPHLPITENHPLPTQIQPSTIQLQSPNIHPHATLIQIQPQVTQMKSALKKWESQINHLEPSFNKMTTSNTQTQPFATKKKVRIVQPQPLTKILTEPSVNEVHPLITKIETPVTRAESGVDHLQHQSIRIDFTKRQPKPPSTKTDTSNVQFQLPVNELKNAIIPKQIPMTDLPTEVIRIDFTKIKKNEQYNKKYLKDGVRG